MRTPMPKCDFNKVALQLGNDGMKTIVAMQWWHWNDGNAMMAQCNYGIENHIDFEMCLHYGLIESKHSLVLEEQDVKNRPIFSWL